MQPQPTILPSPQTAVSATRQSPPPSPTPGWHSQQSIQPTPADRAATEIYSAAQTRTAHHLHTKSPFAPSGFIQKQTRTRQPNLATPKTLSFYRTWGLRGNAAHRNLVCAVRLMHAIEGDGRSAMRSHCLREAVPRQRIRGSNIRRSPTLRDPTTCSARYRRAEKHFA